MKALNVKQPWASMIASGDKTLEVRSWRTRYRGPLVLVASARPDRCASARSHLLSQESPALGVSLCIVDLIDVIPGAPKHAAFTGGIDPTGLFCWVLRSPRLVTQVPMKGRLGIWNVDRATETHFTTTQAGGPACRLI